MAGIFLILVAIAAFVGFWAQWRMHQERADAGPWWRAWGTRATVANLFQPGRLSPEGRRWRLVAFSAWMFMIALIALVSLLGE